jgi:hypothetical protein
MTSTNKNVCYSMDHTSNNNKYTQACYSAKRTRYCYIFASCPLVGNAIVKGKITNRQPIADKTLSGKLKIDQHESTINRV